MSKATDAEYIIVGKIGSTYGIQGWLKIFSFTEITTGILDYNPWYLEEDNNWKPIQIKAGREHGKTIVVQLPGYNTPEQARALTGKKIAIKRSQLPALAKDEYYWSDLEGLMVINQHGQELGKVLYLMETGSNDVLVIENHGKEYAIPYLPGKIITSIDLAKQMIHVDWDLI
ncbi:MAG TPA: ribosome maturation factor RimM [Gammaproteobacteria bacterium]|nr:ribosome maturation factor RimM [Gammaproteobacteria bacterium]